MENSYQPKTRKHSSRMRTACFLAKLISEGPVEFSDHTVIKYVFRFISMGPKVILYPQECC